MESEHLEDALTTRAYASNNPPVMNTATENTTQQESIRGLAGRVKAGTEVHDTQVTSTHTSTKTSVSERTSPSQVDPESSKTSFESLRSGGEKHEHLRGNDTIAPNSTNTGSKVNSRAASLGISSLADESLDSLPAGFGTGLRNDIASVATKPQMSSQKTSHSVDVREPAPLKQLPNINETLGDLAPPRQGNTPLAPAPVKYINVMPAARPATPGEHGLYVNPYVRRADEIGPNHSIPGLGHIGALLTPPGWKIGDEPITDIEADRLYDEARTQAAKMLDVSVSRRGNLSSADHLQRNAEEVEQWQRQHRIDNICLAERKWIHLRWQERKALRSMQAQQQRPVQAQARVVPSPIHPVTQTSIHAYQRHQQAQLPSSPLSPHTSSSPLSAGGLNNRLQCLQRGLHFPVRSPMSPSFLDPSLVPQTLDSVYAHYRTNRITIMQMHDENENFLTNWTTRFGVARPQGLPVTPMPQYMNGTGQQARQLANTHHGYDQDQTCPHPEAPRLLEKGQGMPITQVRGSDHRPYYNQYSGPGLCNSPQQEPFRAPSQLGRTPLLERPQADANRLPERTIERVRTPQSNIGGRKSSSEKPLVWYQELPYAPTANASQGRQKMGSESRSRSSEIINATQQAIRRGKKPTIDVKSGFAVSTDQARRLIALGVNDSTSMRPGTVCGSTLPAGASMQPAPSSGAILNNAHSSNGVAGSGGSANAGTQPELGARSKSRVNSPSPSGESSDDPKDATYGVHPKRKIAARHANASGHKTAVAGRKRKSGTAEPAPPIKRTRMNLDGTTEDDA